VLATSPQVKAAEAKLKTCIAKGDWLTSAGRHYIVTCAMPAAASPTARAKVQKCLQNDITSHGFGLTQRTDLSRPRWERDKGSHGSREPVWEPA
jgi:hypothetical protein